MYIGYETEIAVLVDGILRKPKGKKVNGILYLI